MMVLPVHVRMARAALGWSLSELAQKAKVNINTISRYETGKEAMAGTVRNIEAALFAAGVIFLEPEGELGPGVRLRRQLPLALPDAAPGSKARNKKTKPKPSRK